MQPDSVRLRRGVVPQTHNVTSTAENNTVHKKGNGTTGSIRGTRTRVYFSYAFYASCGRSEADRAL